MFVCSLLIPKLQLCCVVQVPLLATLNVHRNILIMLNTSTTHPKMILRFRVCRASTGMFCGTALDTILDRWQVDHIARL